MKSTTLSVCLLAAILTGASTKHLRAAEDKPAAASNSPADQAWTNIEKNGQMPQQPEAWRHTQPTPEEVDKFKTSEGQRLAKTADLAKEFANKFPTDNRAEQAKAKEYELLRVAAQLGNTNVLARLDTIEDVKLKDTKTSAEERFDIRAGAINRRAVAKLSQSREAAFAELEKGARELIKDFPKRPEGYQMLQEVAMEAPTEKAVKMAKEINESAAPDQVKAGVKPLLRLSKGLSIKFTAVDGRAVDLEKLKGKVVLVDFWATWCGPCVHEVPNVVAAYEKLHPKGFEIVGVSFDQDKSKLVNFTKDQKMSWPQYFDGKQWDNDLGKEFGIQSIPAMWLVDKKGMLRDINGREDLVGKVEKLLAEN